MRHHSRVPVPERDRPHASLIARTSLLQLAEDKTFGLKNKNKSKKVQQYVQSTLKAAADSSRDLAKAKKEQVRNGSGSALEGFYSAVSLVLGFILVT